MSTLATFQANFSKALLSTDQVQFPGMPEDALLTEKFSIYRNNVWHSLSSALMAILPVSVQLVGEDFFRAMATQYAKAHLPTSGTLIGYGEHFADFVRESTAAQSVPYLGDVMAIEFARHHAYHAANQPTLALDALATVAPESMGALQFLLSESVTLLSSDYNAYGLWHAHQSEEVEQLLAALDVHQPSHVIVYRVDFDISVLPVSAAQFAMLSDIASGSTLNALLHNAGERFPDEDAQQLLTNILTSACLTNAVIAPEET